MSKTNSVNAHEYYLFIGTYSPADSNGIFVYKFNTGSGKAEFVSAASGIENPSFLTIGPDHEELFAVSETHNNKDGQVYAYLFDKDNDSLKYINQEPTEGDDPCNIITDHTGKWLFVANYSSGSLAELPVNPNRSVGKLHQLIQHHGHGKIDPGQQSEPHVHCAIMAPNNKDLFVTDLGLDKIFTYTFDAHTGELSPGNPPFTTSIPGSGPRIMTFSPDGKFLYLIHEMGGQITVFDYQPGKLTEVQKLSNLPPYYKGKIWSADLHFSPDGKFLYACNRDDLNDIVTYSVDKNTGKLANIDRLPTGGKTPRNFVISPDGKFVLIGHQNGNEITIFKRDNKTGLLSLTDERIPVSHAVCLKMIKVD